MIHQVQWLSFWPNYLSPVSSAGRGSCVKKATHQVKGWIERAWNNPGCTHTDHWWHSSNLRDPNVSRPQPSSWSQPEAFAEGARVGAFGGQGTKVSSSLKVDTASKSVIGSGPKDQRSTMDSPTVHCPGPGIHNQSSFKALSVWSDS